MISKELADPFGLFFRYLKNFFSTMVLPLFYNHTTNPQRKPPKGLRIRSKRKLRLNGLGFLVWGMDEDLPVLGDAD